MKADLWRSADVVIVGAGPVGCVTALCLARKGAKITLVQANGTPGKWRLSGEWIHPPGVAVLKRLGLDNEPPLNRVVRNRGFLFYRKPTEEPLTLEYPGTERGLSCAHDVILNVLRQSISVDSRIVYINDKKAVEFGPSSVILEDGDRIECTYVIGADGRGSLVRRSLFGVVELTSVSLNIGLELPLAEIPQEGFGHVIVGTHGPILLYRIRPDAVRLCFDVPIKFGKLIRSRPEYLWEACHQDVPLFLKQATRQAIMAGKLSYGVNQVSPRLKLGNDRCVLVGDAAGFTHSLIASGLTLGFEDADRLAELQDLHRFRVQRMRETTVAMMLGATLYTVFTDSSRAGENIRSAMVQLWGDKQHAATTMQLLSGADKRQIVLLGAMVAVFATAGVRSFYPANWSSVWDWFRGTLSIAVRLQITSIMVARYLSARIWSTLHSLINQWSIKLSRRLA